MRIDFYGESHNGIPTPHVHIFVPNKTDDCTVYPLSELKGYNQSKDPKKSLINFLKYNNFINLNQIHFIGKQLSLFNNSHKGGSF